MQEIVYRYWKASECVYEFDTLSTLSDLIHLNCLGAGRDSLSKES